MKNKFYLILSFLLILFCCTACNGSVTRELRHDGFNVGSNFVCDDFYPENKDDISYERVRYFTGTHIITSEGKLYEHSLSQKYTNGQNCVVANTDLKVKSIMDYKVFRSVDDRYIYLDNSNDHKMYDEILPNGKDYDLYKILLGADDVIKVQSVNGSQNTYYVLKNDGNVYAYVLNKADSRSPLSVASVQIVYNSVDYGNIIDFSYSGSSASTYIRTDSRLYRIRNTNKEECTKYVDVECNFVMEEDSIFEKYWDRIIAFNGSILITDYKQVFNVAG